MLEGADHGGSEFWTDEIQDIIIKFFDYSLKNNIYFLR